AVIILMARIALVGIRVLMARVIVLMTRVALVTLLRSTVIVLMMTPVAATIARWGTTTAVVLRFLESTKHTPTHVHFYLLKNFHTSHFLFFRVVRYSLF